MLLLLQLNDNNKMIYRNKFRRSPNVYKFNQQQQQWILLVCLSNMVLKLKNL